MAQELRNIFAEETRDRVPNRLGGNLTIQEDDRLEEPATPIGEAVRQLRDITKFDEEVARESAVAAERNRLVFEDLQAAQETNLNDILDAQQNLEKIARLPQGLTKIMGLFNPDFNPQVQTTRAEGAQLRSQIQTMRAKTRIDLNNQTVEIKKTQLQAAERGLERATALVGLEESALDIQAKQIDVLSKNDALTNQRILTAIEHLSDAEIPRQLALARKGEGEFAGLEGLLEDQVQKKEEFDARLENIRANIAQSRAGTAKINQEMMDSEMRKLAHLIPVDAAEEIAASGEVFYDINGVKVPVNIIAEEAGKNRKVRDELIAGAANRAAEVVSAKEDKALTQIMGISGANPRLSENLLAIVKARRAAVDPKNPATMQLYSASLDNIHTEVMKAGEKYAATFMTAEGKAAYKQYLEDAEFTVPSARLVTREYALNPGGTGNGLHAPTYEMLTREVLQKARQVNVPGTESLSNNPRQAELTAIITALRSGDGVEKLQPAVDAVMADPDVRNRLRQSIEATRQNEILRRALTNIASVKGAAPVWKEVINQLDRDDRMGVATEVPGIIHMLEKRSIAAGGTLDYNGVLLGAVAEAGRSEGAGSATSVKYTDADQAIETHIFGFNPTEAITSNFSAALAEQRQIVQRQIQQEIDRDLATEKERARLEEVYKRNVEGIDPSDPSFPRDKLPPRVASQPSQTIPGMTTGDITSLFGGR